MKTQIVLALPLMVLCLAGQTQAQVLDTTTFVVMGEGLAAGMANYGLSSVMQNKDFAALVAAQMGTGMEQPLIQPPGIGDVVGYPGQEVQVQKYPQGSVRQFYLPTDPTKAPIATPPLLVTNVSVPGLTLNDSVTMLPVAPVVQKGNMKQTVFNMILGMPQLILNNVPLWTQFQYAQAVFPTVTLVELGYYEALTAAVAGNPALLPNPATFAATYGTVIKGFRSLQSQVIVTTIPNPIDTAYFNSIQSSSAIVFTAPFILTAGYQLGANDYITRNGLMAIANQFTNRAISPLPAGSTMSAATAAAITSGVNALNAQIIATAQANGAVVFDLNAFMHSVKASGATAGTTKVTGDFMGGFYSLDGIYPGATGHALIANALLTFINSTYHRSFPLVSLPAVVAGDAATNYLKPQVRQLYTEADLSIQGSLQ